MRGQKFVSDDARLVSEWHPTKNLPETPETVTSGTPRKFWWICPKGHEFEQAVLNRSGGAGCPYCSGRLASPEDNLLVRSPDAAAWWHPTKNGDDTPRTVRHGSAREVWWLCPKGHEFQSRVQNFARYMKCPCCNGKRPAPDTNFAVHYPEVAAQWHPTKNGSLCPEGFIAGSGMKAWWICSHGHEWVAKIRDRVRTGCPVCAGQKTIRETSLGGRYPHLVDEWHPEKNGAVTIYDVAPGTRKVYWWRCRAKGHDFRQSCLARKTGQNCPYCARKRVGMDNTLADLRPDIAARWHPTKNGIVTPKDVGAGSNEKYWFICPVGHEYDATPTDLSRDGAGIGCGFCYGKRVDDSNSVGANYPRLVEEWHPTKNGNLDPNEVKEGSSLRVWWRCARGHEWQAVVRSRTKIGTNCAACRDSTSRWELLVFCEMRMIFGNVTRRDKSLGVEVDILLHDQKIAIEVDGAFWHSPREAQDRAKNDHLSKAGYTVIRVRENPLSLIGDLDVPAPSAEPSPLIVVHVLNKIRGGVDITPEQRASIDAYIVRGVQCDEEGYRDLVSRLPAPPYEESLAAKRPDLVEQWDVEANLPLTPDMFRAGSGHKVWWRCGVGHLWYAQIAKRSNGRGCPNCSGRRLFADNCLAVTRPEIAAEWHPEKNGDLTPVDVPTHSQKKVWWKCKEGHEWQYLVASRTHPRSPGNCPQCRIIGRRAMKADAAKQSSTGLQPPKIFRQSELPF